MLDGKRQGVDILANAGTAHDGLPQKQQQKDWKKVSAESLSCSPPPHPHLHPTPPNDPISQGNELLDRVVRYIGQTYRHPVDRQA